MARIWSSGFELQTLSNFVEVGSSLGSPGGTGASIDTTIKRSGAASLRINPSSVTTAYVEHRLGDFTEFYVRLYLYIATAPTASTKILTVVDENAPAEVVGLLLNTDRTLQALDVTSDTDIGSPSSPLSTGTWYRIEMYVDTSTTTWHITARVDGVEFVDTDYSAGGSGALNGFIFGALKRTAGTHSADLYFDDIAINDTTGTAQTSWPGAGSIVHMQPNAAGDNNNASSGDYSSIDEVTPDDATTYAVLNDNGDILDVNLESSSNAGIGSSDTISLVQVGSRDASVSAATATYVQRIKSQASGTVLEGGTCTHNDTTYKTVGTGEGGLFGYQLTSYVDPQAGGAWTPALLDDTQIGVRATDANPDIRLTTLWLLVEYVPASDVTTTQTITGKARIEKAISQTIAGLSRIQKSASQTIDGLARITATTTRTIAGLASILNTTLQVVTGKARIEVSVTQTVQGVARVEKSTSQTVTGVARVTATVLQTLQGLARITATALRTIPGVARIENATLRTIAGLARITATTTQAITGKSRITATTTQTVTGLARVTATVLQTIAGVARVTASTLRTIPGVARIEKATTQTIQGLSRITATTAQIVTGKARITAQTVQTVQGTARVTASTTRDLTGLARVTVATLRTIQGVSSIINQVSQDILGKARITSVVSRTINGLARITASFSQTITGRARIQNFQTQTITGKARISTTQVRTIAGTARIIRGPWYSGNVVGWYNDNPQAWANPEAVDWQSSNSVSWYVVNGVDWHNSALE